MDEDIKRQSEVMYWALCEIIGDEDVVKLHRTCSALKAFKSQLRKYISTKLISKFFPQYYRGFDIYGIIENYVESMDIDIDFMESGSRAEGFDFPSSDYDFMYILNDIKVIQSPTQGRPSQSHCVLSVENDYTRPGFVRLKALRLPSESSAWSFCSIAWTKLGQIYYLSSSKWRENSCCDVLRIFGYYLDIHGPCANATIHGTEFDYALTLSSETWPMEAVGCVHRLIKRGWPSHDVKRDMVSDGCLFVPIGCKTSPYADIEWRMSFSLAEKRLVHSMNHTQFLTYGLLKLFLKEVVDENDATKGLLCSYFMKTLVFWEILETKTSWTASFFLQNVWNCYRRLLTWIKNEYCPNFFIPENNMFYGKIYGHTRETLLSLLCRHYRTGQLVFFEIPSIRNEIEKQGPQRRFEICNVLRRSHVIEKLYKIAMKDSHIVERNEVLKCSQLNFIVEFQDFIRIYILNLTFFKKLCSDISKVHCNKNKYFNEKSFCRLIKVSSPDCVQSKIFLAIYFYRCKRYESCIRSLHKAIKKLEDERTVLMWKFDPDKYVSLGGDEISISEGMHKFTASNVLLDSCTCIPEISDICNAPAMPLKFQYISPWVLSNFLLCLCHFWKGDVTQARIHLEYIRFCLENRGRLISIDPQDYFVAWHILGIGQEILGDFQDALISYGECTRSMEAWIKPNYLDILELTETKISRLMSLLHSQEQLYRDQMLKTPG